MGASRSIRPCSTRRRTAAAVTGLATQASRYTVIGVAGTVFSTSESPYPADQRSSRSRTTPTERPGAPRRGRAAWIAESRAAACAAGRLARPEVTSGDGDGARDGEATGEGATGDGEAGRVGLAADAMAIRTATPTNPGPSASWACTPR